MQDGTDYYIAAAVLGAALLVKSPGLLRGWRNPTVRAVYALLFLPCAGFVLSAPPTVAYVNRISAVSNLSALLVHCIMTAFACASLVLLAYWRGEPGDLARTRRRVRVWQTGCCGVIAVLAGLFALGDVPVERPRDFDTYYAATPFISQMLVLYLLVYVAAGVATGVVCWGWILDVRGKTAHRSRTSVDSCLRVGLMVLVTAALANVVFGSFKLAAIAARWAGRDWDALNESLPPFMSASGMMVGVGLLVPAYGPALIDRVWQPLVGITALRPLWRLVSSPANTRNDSIFLPPPWYAGPEQTLLYRMTTIHDWMRDLSVHCADDIREQACLRARRSGASQREATAAGLAAMFTAASDARAREVPPAPDRGAGVVAAVRRAEQADRDLLVSISRALATTRRRGGADRHAYRRTPTTCS
ncbi:DUF6545 domain-containing protein [Streptomyces sp. SCSIO 30461]|uniref:DUF6545 domain-containing protein n=1 Tax=Streptomyces sp. SCSIO 30461 TaxID=3118085 RepID=UPI0030D19DE0